MLKHSDKTSAIQMYHNNKQIMVILKHNDNTTRSRYIMIRSKIAAMLKRNDKAFTIQMYHTISGDDAKTQ